MKHVFLIFIAAAALFVASCTEKKNTPEITINADTTAVVSDTTVYGECGDGTTMNCLELKTADGETVRYIVEPDSLYSPVKGGMLAGDRMAVTGHKVGDEMIADKVINLTTLLGRWSSIDKNFEIQEGGLVKSSTAENNYQKWEIFNGKLILVPDTFSVFALGPDSLMLENNNGIFVFARLN